MEPIPSSSSTSSTSHDHLHHQHQHHQPRRPIPPAQPVVDRIIRAIRHPLLLLHRSAESNFFVLGATGNVYTVTLSANPTCTCPDPTTPCKHILFILIRVLGVSLDDSCLRRRTLRPCQLNRLLSTPVHPESLAGADLRETFHQLYFQSSSSSTVPIIRGNNNQSITEEEEETTTEEGTTCPICLEEIIIRLREKVVVACGTCRNLIHEECLLRWKRSRGRRGTICVICRARWRRESDNNNRYLNLAAYITTPTTNDDADNDAATVTASNDSLCSRSNNNHNNGT